MEIELGWCIGFLFFFDVLLCFLVEMDSWNFSFKQVGMYWVDIVCVGCLLCVLDEQCWDLMDQFFIYEDGVFVLFCDVMLLMIILEIVIIQDDCFGYLMEQIDLVFQYGIWVDI